MTRENDVMPLPGDWEECLDRLYDSVGRDDALSDALGRFRPFFDARRATFLTMPDSTSQRSIHIANCGVPNATLVEYHAHHHQHDEWVISARKMGGIRVNAVYRGSDLVPPQRLKNTYFWRDFLVRHNVSDILGTVVEVAGDEGPAAMCTFQRETGQAPYEKACLRQMAVLAPHLRRALRLHRRLAPAVAIGLTLKEVFLAADTPLMFVARDGQVVESNAAAVKMLERMKAAVRVETGQLTYRNLRSWRSIETDLKRFESETVESFELFAKSLDSSEALNLTVRRMHGAFSDELANYSLAAVITLSAVTIDQSAGIRERYRLTAAEVRVATLLARGVSVGEVAQELKVAVATVRTHLASLFAKTATKRQAELVTLLLRGD